MGEIDRRLRCLEEAGGLAAALAASWDAFDLLTAICQQSGHGAHELFAAYAFAAPAAAQGRTIVRAAPSLPAGHGAMTGAGECVPDDLDELADSLAGLARVLHGCLASAAREAPDPVDGAACADAAIQAALVWELLAGDR